RALINQILVERTGQDQERIVRDTDRDFFMNAEQAVAYGLVDEVLMVAQTLPSKVGA
ncbi:MAG TPA: ATP-dependent Clp protease proteolytic subunit, partial [Chloroflexota bacterium]